MDLDDHTLRIHPGLPVARGVAGDGFGHRVGGGDDMSLTFEREPAPSLELAHRDPATRTDVVGLAARPAADDPGEAGLAVPREAGRRDVRGAVGANRGDGRKVSFGDELEPRRGEQRHRSDELTVVVGKDRWSVVDLFA